MGVRPNRRDGRLGRLLVTGDLQESVFGIFVPDQAHRELSHVSLDLSEERRACLGIQNRVEESVQGPAEARVLTPQGFRLGGQPRRVLEGLAEVSAGFFAGEVIRYLPVK